MKGNFTLLVALCLLFIVKPLFLRSQYCMLAGQTPYSSLQPGITNFKLNTINRNSSNSESASSVVVTTGQSTTLTAGQTYTISISHSEDYQIFAGARNNLRVWLDYNSNFSYTDAGETILTKDLEAPATTYSATFTVPLSTPGGTYALRATAKMSADAGHTLPTPCNVPSDPLGYHGEMEDYTVFVLASNPGQAPVANFQLASTVCVTSAATVTNASTGTPTPTYSWTASPSAGVTFSPNNTALNPKVTFTATGNYTITCLATNSISTSSVNKVIAVSICTTVDVAETELTGELTVCPVPARDFLLIGLPGEKDPVRIVVSNLLGEKVLDEQFESYSGELLTLDVSALKNGIYIIRSNQGLKPVTRPIIINR